MNHAALITPLRECATFEDAARLSLEALLGSLGSTELHPQGGSVHLRPDAGYRGLITLSLDGDAEVDLRPSMAAWRAVSRWGRPTVLDVFAESLKPEGEAAEGISLRLPEAPQGASLARLRGREATHSICLPLMDLGGEVVGMVSLDLRAPALVGAPGALESHLRGLQLAADLAAPFLLARPSGAAEPIQTDPLLPVIGARMAPLIRLLQIFSQHEGTLLLQGPTGVGKSRLAQWCHAQSPRREGPCVLVNLLSLPEDTQLGALLGWRKGAYTGAQREAPGLVERAQGGTLFLDEISSLSLKAQAGLLQLLEGGRYRPLGAASEVTLDARIIVGANEDLRAAVAAGRFREDLYYRINVLPMVLPPLAERRDEIGPWAQFMVRRRHSGLGLPGEVAVSPEAVALLRARPWPGNLRQLDNVLARAHAIALAAAPAPGGGQTLHVGHVQQAIAFDGPMSEGEGAFEAMTQGAQAFVVAALRAREQGGCLELDHWRAFEGMVLQSASEMVGDVEEAFRLLGRAAMLEGRNHHKLMRRARGRVDALKEALSR